VPSRSRTFSSSTNPCSTARATLSVPTRLATLHRARLSTTACSSASLAVVERLVDGERDLPVLEGLAQHVGVADGDEESFVRLAFVE